VDEVCADAAVIMASMSAAMVSVFIVFIFLAAEVQRDRNPQVLAPPKLTEC
jgi:hypothetical protein